MRLLVILLVIALLLGPCVLLGGWITMLCLGALAHIFGQAWLAIAFWPSILVDIILSVLLWQPKS